MSVFAFIAGLVGRCQCLHLLLDLLSGAGVSAVGTTLLHSPGGNEGKARYATLGKHRQKRIELRRSGTTEHSFGLCHCRVAVGGVPLLKELKGCRKRLTQGLRAGLCRSIALTGLFYDTITQLLCCFDELTRTTTSI